MTRQADLTAGGVRAALRQTRRAGHRYALIPDEAARLLCDEDDDPADPWACAAWLEIGDLLGLRDPDVCGATCRRADCRLVCLLPDEHSGWAHGFTHTVTGLGIAARPDGAAFAIVISPVAEALRAQIDSAARISRRASALFAEARGVEPYDASRLDADHGTGYGLQQDRPDAALWVHEDGDPDG